MKAFTLFTLLVATLLGLTLSTTYGQQTQTSTTTTTYVQTSKIVGMKVKDSSGQEVGIVKDVVLDRNTGCMAYTVLSTGGTGTRVAGGTKTVAVPWTVYTPTSDPSVMTVRVERDRVYNAPAFDYGRIDEYSRSGYINNIYSYYGVAPAVGVGVGVSGTTTTGTYGTQTGVAGQTAATASPNAASPAAPATASPSAAASASPAATAKATPSSTAGASHRTHASPSATAEEQKGERKTRRHGEGEATAIPGISSSEEGTTEQKAGRHHKTTEEEETTSETGTSKKRERSKEKSEAEPTATP
jgi:sporulation protein YlmC with PRC-barrel domain